MLNSNLIYVLAAVAVLALNVANVEGADVPALITAFNNFFTGLDEICGNKQVVSDARKAYDQCIANVSTYDELITCAQTAYDVYHPHVMNALRTQNQKVLDLKNSLSAAILLATTDEPPERKLIPIQKVQALGMAASSVQLRSQGRQER